MKIKLVVSDDNEATSSPWWVIINPSFLKDWQSGEEYWDEEMAIQMIASAVTGPFFSREEAESTLKRTRYNYSKSTIVYCKSGCYTDQYDDAMRKKFKPWFDKPILRELVWFQYLPYRLEQWLKRRA